MGHASGVRMGKGHHKQEILEEIPKITVSSTNLLSTMEIPTDEIINANNEDSHNVINESNIYIFLKQKDKNSFNLRHCSDNHPNARKHTAILSARPWLVLG